MTKMDQTKKLLDKIFKTNLMAYYQIRDIGSIDTAISQMNILGAWSTVLMNIRWMQRLYERIGYNMDSEFENEMPDLTGDRVKDLDYAILILEEATEALEGGEIPWGNLHNSNMVWHQDLLKEHFLNVFSGMVEAKFMLENEKENWINMLKNRNDNQTSDNNEISNGSNPTDSSD